MSIFSDPFNANSRLRCSCGAHASPAEHDAEQARAGSLADDALTASVVEQAVMRAVFP